MNTDIFETFICVAESSSFTTAAKKLYISSTAVMKKINSFEEALGVTLFERSKSGVSLTPAGNSFYHDAKRILSLLDESIKNAKRIQADRQRDIRVGFSAFNRSDIFLEYWLKILHMFPNFVLKLIPISDYFQDTYTMIDNLNKDFDFLICHLGALEDNSENLNSLELKRYGFSCSFPKDIIPANKTAIHLSDLYGLTLVMVKHGKYMNCNLLREEIEREHPQINIEDIDTAPDIDTFNRCYHDNKVLLTSECWCDIHPAMKPIPLLWDRPDNPGQKPTSFGIVWSKDAPDSVQRIADALRVSND